jgi:transcriptional regulator with XRE-family HTH domain
MLKEEKSYTLNLALRTAREEIGFSQQQVARLVGTNAFTVCRWERGLAFPSPHYRQKLSQIFGKSASELGLIMPGAKSAEDLSFREEDGYTLTRPLRPSHHSELVGREHILAQIRKHLLPGTSSILYGLPGIGKTAIAVKLADEEEVQARFSDGILWARFNDAPDVLGILRSWAYILGFSSAEIASLATLPKLRRALKDAVRERKLLFVLDDVWDIDSLLALSFGSVTCSYLITTRFLSLAVNFAQEGVLFVPELDLAEGQLLLAQHVPAVVEQYRVQVGELVGVVGGHPLALTLLGHYIYRQAFSEHPRRIQAALALLQQADYRMQLTELIFLPDQMTKVQHSLRGAIAQSVNMLSKTTRTVLKDLATFAPKPETFTEKDVQKVCHLEKGILVTQLDTLIDAGLLENDAAGRYTLHPVIRDYALLCMIDKN